MFGPKRDFVTNLLIVIRRASTVPFPTNTVIAAQLLFPAMSVPIGKARDDDDDPNALELPVGLEIVGLPFREEDLVAIGAGVEAVMKST